MIRPSNTLSFVPNRKAVFFSSRMSNKKLPPVDTSYLRPSVMCMPQSATLVLPPVPVLGTHERGVPVETNEENITRRVR